MLALILANETAAKAAEDGGFFLWRIFAESPFAIAILFIFLVAMIGAFVAARKRDRALKKFRHFCVTIREQAGRVMWGTLRVFSNGLELMYTEKVEMPDGAVKESFLIYQTELGRILEIRRPLDCLDKRCSTRRRRQVRAMAEPNIWFRFWRWLRGIANTFRDAIVQAMNMAIGQATKARPGSALAAQGGQIGAIGTTVVGETANAYEPMLEQYIGDPVVAEIVNPADPEKKIVEYHGYLGEYSPQFFLLVDVADEDRRVLPAAGGPHNLLEQRVELKTDGNLLRVRNSSGVPLHIDSVSAGEHSKEIAQTVEPGASSDITVGEILAADGAQVEVWWRRQMDLILPRSCASVRHASQAVAKK